MSEYYMFHKPRGCISARRDPRHKTVMDYFPEEKRDILFPIGRLDRDTEGLLIITDDGRLCFDLLMPEKQVEKSYFFWALGSLSDEERKEIETGVSIYKSKEFVTAPAKIKIESAATVGEIESLLSEDDKKKFRKRKNVPTFCGVITITEGKKHQVKRMLGYAGCRVIYLKRLSVGKLYLDEKLDTGSYRELSKEEIALLL